MKWMSRRMSCNARPPTRNSNLERVKGCLPPQPPLIKGGLYVLEETTASGSLQKEEKLKQVVGCVCVCVWKAFQSMCVVDDVRPSASDGWLDCFLHPRWTAANSVALKVCFGKSGGLE